MALYTVETPNADNWSKNPVVFKVATTLTGTDAKQLGFSIQMEDYVSGLWNEIYSGIQRFDSDGQTELDIARICDAQLEYYVGKPYDYTVSSPKYIVWKKQARNFRVQFWETDDEVATLIESDDFYVVKGGVAKEQWDKTAVDTYFFDGTNIKFLTYNKNVFRDQGMLFISFYAPATVTSIGTLERSTIGTSTALTTYTFTDTIVQGDVVVFFLDISSLTSDVYQLNFNLDDGLPCSEDLIFNVFTRKYTYGKIYTYINSLGGTEVVYLPFNQIRQTEQQRETFSRLNNNLPVPYQLEVSAESFQTNQTEELVTAIDAGELTAQMQDQMRELTLSPARFEVIWDNLVDGSLKYVPVNVLTKKNMLLNYKSRTPVAMYFEITRAFKNSLYTPGNYDYNSTLLSTAWDGISAPVEDYLYLTIDPLNNPAEFEHYTNGKTFFDYGDNNTAIATGTATHVYADNKKRKIALASLLNSGMGHLHVTTHGKVNKVWGAWPRLLGILKFNTQSLTELPALPVGLIELEVQTNLLTEVPTLPPALTTAKLQNNDITAFETSAIPVTVVHLNLEGNNLPVSVVNYILNTLDTNGASNGYLNLASQTPAAAPTGTGITAKANLVGKGWAVATD